jgi:hypothetical protein
MGNSKYDILNSNQIQTSGRGFGISGLAFYRAIARCIGVW